MSEELKKIIPDLAENLSNANMSKLETTDEVLPAQDFERGFRFWIAMSCIMISTFLAAIDTTAVSTALPTIVASLHGEQFSWVGSAYTLASAATIPFTGNLANFFGRRSVLLGCLLLFAAGSAICGGTQSLNMLIAGRTLQGAGAGGIFTATEMILSDMIPLRARGNYRGMIGLVWAVASCIGPQIGGTFASRKDWTWRGLFYFNLPLTGIAILFCVFCLDLKVPELTVSQKLRQIDWIGNLLITASVTSTLIGLTWGGVQFSWSSARVLVPLILGIFGIFAWVLYEIFMAKQPFLISRLFTNRTTVSGYLGTSIHGIIVSAIIYYFPVYFQACKGASPIRSGANVLPFSFSIAPMAIVAGLTAAATKKYRVQNVVAWCFIIFGLGLDTTLHATSAVRNWVGFELLSGIGLGLLFTATAFPVLSPLPVSDNGTALAIFIFFRSFFQAWGITIGGTVLQNQLKTRLPQAFVQNLSSGIDLAYSAIPQISSLPDDLRLEVQTAFAKSLRMLWFVLLGISVLGLLSSLMMKDIELHDKKDERWGMKEAAPSKKPDGGAQNV